MPLVPTILQTNLRNIMDPGDPNLHPKDVQQAIQNFATAIDNYTLSMAPISTAHPAAVQAFIGAMSPITAPPTETSPTFMDLFPVAMLAYATALGLGMTGAGFAGAPPPGPLELTAAWEMGINGGTTEEVISALVPVIHAWFLTGIATPPPPALPITWI